MGWMRLCILNPIIIIGKYGFMPIGPVGTNFSETTFEIHFFIEEKTFVIREIAANLPRIKYFKVHC